MKHVTATVTPRGEVTVPAEVARELGLKPGDNVALRVDDHEVRIAPATPDLESAFGSVEPVSRPELFDEISRVAKDDKAEASLAELDLR